MSKTKSLVLAAAALALFTAPAFAQFAPTPKDGSVRPTYRASVTGLVTAATATDFLTISGSSTKTVIVKKIMCSGIATTAATADIQVIKRSTANTGGTSTAPTATPLDSSSAAATASVKAYTVNPSALGTSVGVIAADKLALPLAATGAAMQRLTYEFGSLPFTQSVILRGAAQTLSLSGNAATLGTGAAVDCSIEWIEL